MSLKPSRCVQHSDITCFMNEIAERGSFVFEIDKGPNQPYDLISTKPNGNFRGILLTDVVDIDLTRQHLNFYSNQQVQKGGKVEVMRKGWVTMRVSFREKFPIGHPVYINPKTGKPSLVQWGMPIGRLLSKRDKDGYVKIELN